MIIYVVLLIAVLLWMAVTFRGRMAVRDCRWRENRTKDRQDERYFLCVNCGQEAWSRDGVPPKTCLMPADD